MNDLLVNQPVQAAPVGLVRINIGRVLSHLRTAAAPEPIDRYLVACAGVQFWADLLAVGKLNGVLGDTTMEELDEQLRRAECEADCAAQVMLGQVAVASEDVDHLTSASVALHENSSPDSLSKVLHLPMPECCGYDLADLALIAGDADRLTAQVRLDRAFLIVGIRTGGTYLAPLWKAVLTGLGVADVHWCTVRPREGCATSDGLETARAWLEHRFAPVIVVVDDRPDTGATMERVAAPLREPGVDLWFSSVGKLWQGPAAHPMPSHPPAYVMRGSRAPRLWECLLRDEQPEFIARLRGTAGIPSLPAQARLHFRCPQGEVRYGLSRAWLPWNDPRVLNGRRSLVNPRKTPIEILGPDGDALLHLRFIGEGVFGRAEFERMRKMGATGAAWLVDGYAITIDIGATRSFQEQFHTASQPRRADLLLQAANWLTVPARQTIAHTYHSPVVMPLDPRWSAMADTMRERCGCDPLQEISEPLSAFLAEPVPWPGRAGRAFRSSLRYGSGGWHWQVDQHGRLHRFQLDANWGDVSFPELELAAFILENRLAIEDAGQLASLCGLAWSSVRESLSLAALMIVESRVRSVRIPSESGRITLCEDFHQLIRTTSELAEINTPSWK
ncbi:hypothetical protein BK659_18725 [Pseudomonas brassicacearum]|uniref:Neamine phosphoribosyltransferase n=1 Tax=Pseudomonas brassicacearum TaxID=930166 RepID=A0A423H3L1_9PSED|nr:hypothetical protein [Pseudomonas brassicacearum]RON07318.1 hypothetical protein BK659_18725 [Pseudomonas brassicacearum]